MFISEHDRRIQQIYAKTKNPHALSGNRHDVFSDEIQGHMKEFLKT